MDEDYVSNIRNFILANKKPSYTTTNKKEVRVRCPYCGDSVSKPSSAHLYIEMKPPFRFHCFKCETSGRLSLQTLRDLGLEVDDVAMSISKANSLYVNTVKSTPASVSYKKVLKNTPFDTPASRNAVDYFNNRFNSNFTNEYIVEKFKVITDAYAFFKENNLTVMNQFDFANSIGFISSDSSHIIFRDISGLQQQRYFNLNLDQNNDNASKLYNISGEIDSLANPVTLIITEGIFDIIGVYEHFFKDRDNSKTIFAAACGKAYNGVILHYLRMGLLNLNVVIFSDADVDVSFYKEMKRLSPYLKDLNLTIFYNSLYNPETKESKDYGIPKNKISLKKIII